MHTVMNVFSREVLVLRWDDRMDITTTQNNMFRNKRCTRNDLFNTPAINAVLIAVLLSCSPKSGDTNERSAPPVAGVSVKNPALMLSGDWMPQDSRDIDFDNLPRVASEHAIVSDVRDAGGTRVNQHNYLIHFRNRYWVMWSDGAGTPRAPRDKHRETTPYHDLADQRISFATSEDGLKWSAKGDIAGVPDEGFGWIARGFWIRDGKLLALASRFLAPSFAQEGLQLHAFELQEGEPPVWKHAGMVYDDALNNFPPQKLSTGEWMMSRRDHKRNAHFLIGGDKALDQWQSIATVSYGDSTLAPSEPMWWTLPDGALAAMYRDNKASGFLFRSFSSDQGRSWSKPVRTNFPDAKSKFSGARLRDGRYVIVSNPDPEKRDPLAISISDDGVVFNKMFYLVGGSRVDYPHVMEHDGYVLVAYASAKQTVEVLKIKLKDLDSLKMPAVSR